MELLFEGKRIPLQINSEIANLYGWYEILVLGIKFTQEFQYQINQIT
jgi:hypothetical protein